MTRRPMGIGPDRLPEDESIANGPRSRRMFRGTIARIGELPCDTDICPDEIQARREPCAIASPA